MATWRNDFSQYSLNRTKRFYGDIWCAFFSLYSNDNRTARERDIDVSVPSQSSKTGHRRVKTLEESDEEDEVKIQEKGSKKASSTSNADNKTNSVSDSNDDNRNISDGFDGKKRPRDEDDDDSSDDDEEFKRALHSNPKRIKRALYLKDDEDD